MPGWASPAVVIVAGTLGILATAFWLNSEAGVARRVYKDFVFLIAAPLALLLGGALFGVSLLTDLPVEMWQAMIAGLVIASGWLTSAIFNELARARTKAERMRDYHKAIYAEIGTAMDTLFNGGEAESYTNHIIARMHEDAGFVPFIPREKHDFLYEKISANIDVLPRQTIDAIVAYYSLTASISALADDMRSDRFQSLGADRRIEMYRDYAKMRVLAFHFGNHALMLIKAYSEGGTDAAQAVINSQAAAPSARLPEQE
jgi:hypothetical protein